MKKNSNSLQSQADEIDVWQPEDIDENFDIDVFSVLSVTDFDGDYKLFSEYQKKEINRILKHYSIALEQVDSLKRQNRDLKLACDTMENSTSWKLTKPLRFVMDLIKLPFRIRLGKKIRKFLFYWKNYSFKYAMAKLRQSRLTRSQTDGVSIIISDEVREVEALTKFPKDVKISILVPLYNTPHEFLVQMIESVRAQTYSNWELCLADGSDADHSDVYKTCYRYIHQDERIKYKKLEKNLGISENTNACIEMATGNYIALFDHDDLLHPSVLHSVMTAICEENADYVYTDEATFESPNVTKILSVHYKPDFAIDTLRANNYICHFSVFSREVLEKSGNFRSAYDGSQDHDMILRLTSNAKKIVHIPRVLYFWRSHPLSVAMNINSKKYAIEAGKNAVKTAIESVGYTADVESTKVFPAMYRIKYGLNDNGLVSIILYNPKDIKVLEKCAQSIKERTTYENFELIVATDSDAPKKILSLISKYVSDGFVKLHVSENTASLPALLNKAASAALGKYLLFFDGDAIPISKDWIQELMMYAQRDDVAISAGALYYPTNIIRHAGYVIGNGPARSVARLFYGIDNSSIGYMG